MNPINERGLQIARRHFFGQCGVGVGKIALASLLTDAFANRSALAGSAPSPADPVGRKSRPISAPKAKHVIHLFMAGGAEPARSVRLQARAGPAGRKADPAVGDRRAALRLHPLRRRRCSARDSNSSGTASCGIELAEVLPHLGEVVDDVCFVKSVHTDQFNHAPAQIFFNTGFAQPGRPSMGSWVLTALGSEAQNLAGFVVMSTGSGISGGAANWSSGFLPTLYAGVRFRNQGDPILDVSNPAGVDAGLAARFARPDRRAQPSGGWQSRATRKSPRAWPATKWPTACKPRPPS